MSRLLAGYPFVIEAERQNYIGARVLRLAKAVDELYAEDVIDEQSARQMLDRVHTLFSNLQENAALPSLLMAIQGDKRAPGLKP